MSNRPKAHISVTVKIPKDQWLGLQRFKGDTDPQRINTIIRLANRRVDQVQRQGQAAVDAALEPVPDAG